MPTGVMPLPFKPPRLRGLSEHLLASHYENNYGGAVKRLNAITEQLAALDYAKAPGFLINGLKREELIAANSMILHELYFAGLGEESRPGAALAEAMNRDFGSFDRWRAEFAAMGKAQGGGSAHEVKNWLAAFAGQDAKRLRTRQRWYRDIPELIAGFGILFRA